MTETSLIGYIAALITTASFLPQTIKTIRTKNTQGLSLFMYIILSSGVFLWLVYGCLIGDMPLIAANAVTLVFALIILGYKIRYK
ncbi:MAG: SemiSWEET transporter [Salinivirgaceae bacterium]|jgi:MtN3 and saliva related transmembrane protein